MVHFGSLSVQCAADALCGLSLSLSLLFVALIHVCLTDELGVCVLSVLQGSLICRYLKYILLEISCGHSYNQTSSSGLNKN